MEPKIKRLNDSLSLVEITNIPVSKEGGFEPDSSPIAWKYYSMIYNNGIEFKKTKQNVRLVASISKNSKGFIEPENKNAAIEVAGDCSFNFNEKKVQLFKEIIDNDQQTVDEEKSKLRNILEMECEKRHHTLFNFCLIPVTGGMNNSKGKLKYNEENNDYKIKVHYIGRSPKHLHDRLDSFIYLLNETFIQRNEFNNNKMANLKDIGSFLSESIFTVSMISENFGYLYDYLLNYQDIYEYCEDYYNIDCKKFVDRLIENGAKPIGNADDIKRYMNLARDFWAIQKKVYEKVVLKESKEELHALLKSF